MNTPNKCSFCICPQCTHFAQGCPQKRPCLRLCASEGLIKTCELFENTEMQKNSVSTEK